MKGLLLVSLVLLVVLGTSADSFAQNESQLSVISFGWSPYVPALSDEPEWGSSSTPTRRQQIYDRERQTVERGYGDLIRSRDLRQIEHDAVNSSVRQSSLFTYKVKLLNTHEKTVKNIYWDYQITDTANPATPTVRRFFCTQKIRFRQHVNLQAISPARPMARTINAKAGSAKNGFADSIVINRVEYADNTAWQREGWDVPDSITAALSNYKRAPGEPACTTY